MLLLLITSLLTYNVYAQSNLADLPMNKTKNYLDNLYIQFSNFPSSSLSINDIINYRCQNYISDSLFIDSLFRSKITIVKQQLSRKTGLSLTGSYFYRVGSFSMDFENDDYAPFKQKLQGTLSWNYFDSPLYHKNKRFNLLDDEMKLSMNKYIANSKSQDWRKINDNISESFSSSYFIIYERQLQMLQSLLNLIDSASIDKYYDEYYYCFTEMKKVKANYDYLSSIAAQSGNIISLNGQNVRLDYNKMIACAISNNSDLKNIKLEKSVNQSKKDLVNFTDNLEVSPFIRSQYYIRDISANSGSVDAGISVRIPLDFDTKLKKQEISAQNGILDVEYQQAKENIENKISNYINNDNQLLGQITSHILNINAILSEVEDDIISIQNNNILLNDVFKHIVNFSNYYSQLIDIYNIMEQHCILMSQAAEFVGASKMNDIIVKDTSSFSDFIGIHNTKTTLVINQILDCDINMLALSNVLKSSRMNICLTLKDYLTDESYKLYSNLVGARGLECYVLVNDSVLNNKSDKDIELFLNRFSFINSKELFLQINDLSKCINCQSIILLLNKWCNNNDLKFGLIVNPNISHEILSQLCGNEKVDIVYLTNYHNFNKNTKNEYIMKPIDINLLSDNNLEILKGNNKLFIEDSYSLLYLRLIESSIGTSNSSSIGKYKLLVKGYKSYKAAENDAIYFEQIYKHHVSIQESGDKYVIEVLDFVSPKEINDMTQEAIKKLKNESLCNMSRVLFKK